MIVLNSTNLPSEYRSNFRKSGINVGHKLFGQQKGLYSFTNKAL